MSSGMDLSEHEDGLFYGKLCTVGLVVGRLYDFDRLCVLDGVWALTISLFFFSC